MTGTRRFTGKPSESGTRTRTGRRGRRFNRPGSDPSRMTFRPNVWARRPLPPYIRSILPTEARDVLANHPAVAFGEQGELQSAALDSGPGGGLGFAQPLADDLA